jgi:hypothetical protein
LERQEKSLLALKKELAALDAKIAKHDGKIHSLFDLLCSCCLQSIIDAMNNTSALNLDPASLQEYTKLRDVVSSRTFAEKTRLVSAQQVVEGLQDTKQRMDSRLESMQDRRGILGEEKEELIRKRDAVCFSFF